MTALATAALPFCWDLTAESPTLGGALVLRMEAELLAAADPSTRLTVHVAGPRASTVRPLIEAVFLTTSYPCDIADTPPPYTAWPDVSARLQPGFSYFSFARVCALHAASRRRPLLSWSEDIRAQAAAVRQRYSGRLVCIHLRQVPGGTLAESNADFGVWRPFLAAHAIPGRREFVLLGDDPLPSEFLHIPGVSRAVDLGVSLSVQLALIQQADGFLGTASGVCTAANFSSTPHVIFKHPRHHAAAMQAELGEADRFPFADHQQRLWRRVADRTSLEQALDLIES